MTIGWYIDPFSFLKLLCYLNNHDLHSPNLKWVALSLPILVSRGSIKDFNWVVQSFDWSAGVTEEGYTLL